MFCLEGVCATASSPLRLNVHAPTPFLQWPEAEADFPTFAVSLPLLSCWQCYVYHLQTLCLCLFLPLLISSTFLAHVIQANKCDYRHNHILLANGYFLTRLPPEQLGHHSSNPHLFTVCPSSPSNQLYNPLWSEFRPSPCTLEIDHDLEIIKFNDLSSTFILLDIAPLVKLASQLPGQCHRCATCRVSCTGP